MSPCYDLHLENRKPSFLQALQLTVRHQNTKFSNKMFGGLEDIIWTNTDILTLDCKLDLECSYPIFFQKTLWLLMMYHQTKFSCQGNNTSQDVAERVIVWSQEPWLWPWREDSKQLLISTWHSGSWCYITIPSLARKCSAFQTISSTQTLTSIFNLCCDLDLEHSHPIFPQNTPVYDAVLSIQLWLQIDQQFRR